MPIDASEYNTHESDERQPGMIALALLFALILYGVLAWSVIRALGWPGGVCFHLIHDEDVQGITLALFR